MECRVEWLHEDLTKANTVASRKLRPWIIVHYYRPAYSTNIGIHFSDPVAHKTITTSLENYLFQYFNKVGPKSIRFILDHARMFAS